MALQGPFRGSCGVQSDCAPQDSSLDEARNAVLAGPYKGRPDSLPGPKIGPIWADFDQNRQKSGQKCPDFCRKIDQIFRPILSKTPKNPLRGYPTGGPAKIGQFLRGRSKWVP